MLATEERPLVREAADRTAAPLQSCQHVTQRGSYSDEDEGPDRPKLKEEPRIKDRRWWGTRGSPRLSGHPRGGTLLVGAFSTENNLHVSSKRREWT